MRRHHDRDEHVAGPPWPGMPWPRTRTCCPVVMPGGIFTSIFCRSEAAAAGGAFRRLRQRHRHVACTSAPPPKSSPSKCARPPRPPAAPPKASRKMSSKPPAPPGRAGSSGRSPRARSGNSRNGNRRKRRRAARTAGAKIFEAVEFRLSLGVDLAAVEGLALVLVADDFVGGVRARKSAPPPSGRSCWRRDAAFSPAAGRRF